MLKLEKSLSGLRTLVGSSSSSRADYPCVFVSSSELSAKTQELCFSKADNVDLMMDLSYKSNNSGLYTNGIHTSSFTNHKDISTTMISNEKPGMTRPAKGLFSIRDLVKCDNEQGTIVSLIFASTSISLAFSLSPCPLEC